jgi:uncharacterized SAM-binding protein YcdF (DUF218 family)
MKLRSRRIWLFLAVGGLLLLAFATRQRTLPWLARWLDVGSRPQKADAVVLLNGSLNVRPFFAAALVHGGWAPEIWLNTVAAHPNQESGAIPPFFEINLKVLEYGGVPTERIVRLDSDARTTFDEAKAVADYLVDHPVQRLMILTEGPHSRRSRWIFQHLLADRQIEIAMVSAPTDEFDNENWWQSEAGFLFVVSEYFKLFFYGLRYGRLGYEIVAGLAVMILFYAWFSQWRKRFSHGNRAGSDSATALK